MTFDLDPTVTAGELLTVGAAVLAAVVVVVQSVYTAQSAKASKDAAEAATKGLRVATKALDVAGKEEKHSRTLVIEAHRARIDAALPKISVIAGEAGWLHTCTQPEHGEWKSFHHEVELYLPGQRDVTVAVGSWVDLLNGSERIVEVNLEYTAGESDLNVPPPAGSQVESRRVVLLPGKPQRLHFWSWTTLADWVEHGNPRDNRGYRQRSAPIVRFNDPADSGADIEWRLVVEGLPFERRDHDAAFVMPRNGPTVRVLWENREYWLSKRQGVRLDPPALD